MKPRVQAPELGQHGGGAEVSGVPVIPVPCDLEGWLGY